MRMMSRCFTWFPNQLIQENPKYTTIWDFTRMWYDLECIFYSSFIIPLHPFPFVVLFFFSFFAFFSQYFSNFSKSSAGMFLHTMEIGQSFIKRGQITNYLCILSIRFWLLMSPNLSLFDISPCIYSIYNSGFNSYLTILSISYPFPIC